MQTNTTRHQRRGSAVTTTTRPNPTTTTYGNDGTALKQQQQQKKQKMGFRRTMRRWFGGRYKQMSKGEVRELDRQITAEMHAGTFSAVRRGGQQVPTADQLWKEGVTADDEDDDEADEGPTGMGMGMGMGVMSPSPLRRPPTSVSQASRGNRYYDDDFDDDYGGYQDGYGHGGGGGRGQNFGGGGSSGDSGYAGGYYERPPLGPMSPPPFPQQPRGLPAWYVPGGGPFDMPEAKPESVYGGGGSRANSMMSTATRGSRRPSAPHLQLPRANGYYTPPRRVPGRPGMGIGGMGNGMGANRAYSMQSDPGRLVYARSPQPRRPFVTAAPSWNGQYHDDGSGGEMGPGYEGMGGRGGGGGGYGYRGWGGGDIGEHEYPLDNNGFYEEDYRHPS